MPHNISIKNYQKEGRLFSHRCISVLILVLIVLAILVVRLYDLQINEHYFYSTLSQNNLLNLIPIEPNRGLIYDRKGTLLAKNIPTFSLVLIPNQVKNIDTTLEKLQQVVDLSQDEIKQFYRIRNQFRPFQPVPLKLHLTELEAARFYINQYQFPGVIIQTALMRYYPFANGMSSLLGYVSRINQQELMVVDQQNYTPSTNIGKVGVEKQYETLLHGLLGSEEAEIDARGHIVRILKRNPPTSGQNIYLTLDNQLQAKAQQALGTENGAIVVINPSTGEILAWVSNPSYDPNLFTRGITQVEYKNLLNAPDHPLYNRVIRGQYAPGSTIKPFYAIAGLENQVINPNFRIHDPGWFELPNYSRPFRDWKKGGHGWVNLARAIMVSCDIYFFNLGVNLGINRMDNVLYAFGFGKKTNVDIPGELPGVVPSPKWKMGAQGHGWYPGDTVNTAIGQGYTLFTPIQLAQAVSTLANRGKQVTPHLLLRSVDTTNKITPYVPQEKITLQLRDPKIWETIIHDMQAVVDDPEGTGKLFGPHPGFTVAAKTGTAQVYGLPQDEEKVDPNLPKNLQSNHLFIAFAPVDHPQIAIAIVVEHNSTAHKAAGEIFNYFFARERTHHAPPQRTQ